MTLGRPPRSPAPSRKRFQGIAQLPGRQRPDRLAGGGDRRGRGGGWRRAGRRGTSWMKRSRVTATRPRWPLMRAISGSARCCSSIATGPAQAMASVPENSFRRVVTAGQRRADDRLPVGQDLRGGRGALAERRAHDGGQQGGDRARPVDVARSAPVAWAACRSSGCPVIPPPMPCAADLLRLVRPPSPPPALAGAARRAGRSVPGLAQRDHAAADHGGGGRPYYEKFLSPLPRRAGACRGAGGRR